MKRKIKKIIYKNTKNVLKSIENNKNIKEETLNNDKSIQSPDIMKCECGTKENKNIIILNDLEIDYSNLKLGRIVILINNMK